MIVEPKVKGFICTTAHPAGCKESVRRQIAYCKEKGMVEGPKKVLVIGSSTGPDRYKHSHSTDDPRRQHRSAHPDVPCAVSPDLPVRQ